MEASDRAGAAITAGDPLRTPAYSNFDSRFNPLNAATL